MCRKTAWRRASNINGPCEGFWVRVHGKDAGAEMLAWELERVVEGLARERKREVRVALHVIEDRTERVTVEHMNDCWHYDKPLFHVLAYFGSFLLIMRSSL
jgi:hypothetical protein